MAKQAGHDRGRFYELRRKDEAFAAEWAQAQEAGIDASEDELKAYATEGWDEETFDASGKLTRRVRRRDPRLLLRMHEWRRPAEQRVDVFTTTVSEQKSTIDLGKVAQIMAEAGVTIPPALLGDGDVIDADVIDQEDES